MIGLGTGRAQFGPRMLGISDHTKSWDRFHHLVGS